MSTCVGGSGIFKYVAEQVPGAVIALIVSFICAELYFRRQRKIDKNKEEKNVQLSYRKLVNAFITSMGKRSKHAFDIREAMSEFELRLKVYRPEFDANQMMKAAGEQAKKTIQDNPGEFEDISKP